MVDPTNPDTMRTDSKFKKEPHIGRDTFHMAHMGITIIASTVVVADASVKKANARSN